jgi:hypothetical protein
MSYSDPELWAWAKSEAMRRAHRRNPARRGWDARIAQDAGRIYRQAGGRYVGPKTRAQQNLSKWTREDWTTATGKKACRMVNGKRVCDRYLPRAAWAKLTPSQKQATRKRKLAAKTKYVANAPAAKRAGQYARKHSTTR